MEQNNARVEWTRAKTFALNGVVVVVSMLPLRKPLYTIAIEFEHPDDPSKVNRHYQCRVSGQGSVQVAHMPKAILAGLLCEAEDWILVQAQAAEDKAIEERLWREHRDLDRGKPKQAPGIGSLGKRDGQGKQKQVAK